MLSFNAYLDEKKSQIKVNPRKADLYEKEDCGCDDTKPKKTVCKECMGAGVKGGETCTHCEGKGYHMESEGEGSAEGVAEPKRKTILIWKQILRSVKRIMKRLVRTL